MPRARFLPCLLLLVLAAPLAPAAELAAQEAPLLTLLPRDEEARQLELRADLQMIRKNYWQAIELYQQAQALFPGNAVLFNKIGIAYHQLGRLKDARKHYERATKVNKQYAQAWNNLGAVHYGQKNYRKAIQNYRRALEYSPAQAAIHGNLGAAMFARKKYDEALEEFRLALLLDPDVFQTRNLFGILMQDYTVHDRARFHFMLAKSYALLANVERCLLYLRRALEEGYPAEQLQADPAFALVSEDRRFQALLAAPPQPIKP